MVEYRKLDELCNINMGQSPDSMSYNEFADGLPFFQGNADFGVMYPIPRIWCNAPIKVVEPETLLISVRAPIGALNFAKVQSCIGRGLAGITSKEGVNLKYIYYCLQGKNAELNRKGTGSTFKAIAKKDLGETVVKVISEEEQTEIIQILDMVSAIIENRQQQLTELDNLIKARFVELFGDLKSNNKGWHIANFKECAEIDTNMVHDFEGYEEYPHIGIDSIEKDTGRLVGYRTISEDGVISGKYLFTPKHIIYSKIRPNLNKVALPEFDGLCSADAYPILVKEDVCNREFLGYTLRSKYFLDYILAFSNRTNLPKVNKNQVEGFSLPLPPLELQEQFADFVHQIDKSKSVVLLAVKLSQLLCDKYDKITKLTINKANY